MEKSSTYFFLIAKKRKENEKKMLIVAARKYAWENGLYHLLFEVGVEKEMKPGRGPRGLILRTERCGHRDTVGTRGRNLLVKSFQTHSVIWRESFTWSSKWYSPVSSPDKSARGVYKDPSLCLGMSKYILVISLTLIQCSAFSW